jgi:UPF0042 nucleotide-binding protein
LKPLVVIITGLSGSGKTVALRALEDSGFFCVDNLPPSLVEAFIQTAVKGKRAHRLGIGIDVREREFLGDVLPLFQRLRECYSLQVLYLEADTDTLIRRYKETRRPHPLRDCQSLRECIQKEQALLQPLKEAADKVLQSSTLSPHQLRDTVARLYGGATQGMTLTLMSFGFKFGPPQEADLVFDVRFLENPHFVPHLRPLSGLDAPVAQFVLGRDPKAREFLQRLKDFLGFLIPLYRQEGKSTLTVALGCTGGRHRSPAVVEALAKELRAQGHAPEVLHRDIS